MLAACCCLVANFEAASNGQDQDQTVTLDNLLSSDGRFFLKSDDGAFWPLHPLYSTSAWAQQPYWELFINRDSDKFVEADFWIVKPTHGAWYPVRRIIKYYYGHLYVSSILKTWCSAANMVPVKTHVLDMSTFV